ncbi:MAG TPA: DUF2325 domain-containing protein [Spirochaetota bacterium]|nr:DUF2325 domain-containing protein [Spirochaetota bacterium]
MRIAIIGGLERNDYKYAEMASVSGHILENHTGRTGGRGPAEMQRLINRASLVIIQITINSHGGVHMAKRIAKQKQKPAVVIPRLGQSGFREILDKINRNPDYFNGK